MDVAALVERMHENLSEIHSTITGLSTEEHNARLDELEKKRESLIALLQANFDREKDELEAKHQAEISAIKEKRRIEDEEREARRRKEDEDLEARKSTEHAERQEKLGGEITNVEEETEQEMDAVEEEARKLVDTGRGKLQELEEKRREINRLIDEQLQMPLPPVPSRKRVRGEKINGASNGTPTSMPAPSEAESRSLGNSDKASEETVPSSPPHLVESQPGVPEKIAEKDDEIAPADSGTSNVVIPSEAIEKDPDLEQLEANDDPTDKNEHEPEQKPSEALEKTPDPEQLEANDDPADKNDHEPEQKSSEGHSLTTDEESQVPSQVVDSAIGLDPNVEAAQKDSQPASPSGSNSHDLPDNENLDHEDGDQSTHHDTTNLSDANDAPQEPPSGPIAEPLKSKSSDDPNEVGTDMAHAEDPPQVDDQAEVEKVEATQTPPQPDEASHELGNDEATIPIAVQDPVEREEGNEDEHEAAHASDSIPLGAEQEHSPIQETEENEHERAVDETHSPVVGHQRDVEVHEEPTTQSDEHQSDKDPELQGGDEHDIDIPLDEENPLLESEHTSDPPEEVNHDHTTSDPHSQEEDIQEVPSSPFLSRPTTPVEDNGDTLLSPQESRDVEEQPPHSQPEEEQDTPSSPRVSRPVTPVQNSETTPSSQQTSAEVEVEGKNENSVVQTPAAQTSAADPGDNLPQQEPDTVRDIGIEQDPPSVSVPESTSERDLDGAHSEALPPPIQSALNEDMKDCESEQMVSAAQSQPQAHAVDSDSGSMEPSDVPTLQTSAPVQTENQTFLDHDHETINDSEINTKDDIAIEGTHDHDISHEVADLTEDEVQQHPTDNNPESTLDEVHHEAHSSPDVNPVTDDELHPNGSGAFDGTGEVTSELQPMQQAQTVPEVQSTPSSPTISKSVPVHENNSPIQEGNSHEQENLAEEDYLSKEEHLPDEVKLSKQGEDLPEHERGSPQLLEDPLKQEEVAAEKNPTKGSPTMGASIPVLPNEAASEQDDDVTEAHPVPISPKLSSTHEGLPEQEAGGVEAVSVQDSHNIDASSPVSTDESVADRKGEIAEAHSMPSTTIVISEENSPKQDEAAEDKSVSNSSVAPEDNSTKQEEMVSEEHSVPNTTTSVSEQNSPEQEAENAETNSTSSSPTGAISTSVPPDNNSFKQEEEIAEPHSISNISNIPVSEENSYRLEQEEEEPIVEEQSIPSSPKIVYSPEQSSSTLQEALVDSNPISDATHNTTFMQGTLEENGSGSSSNDHSPGQIIQIENDLLHKDIDPTNLEHDPPSSLGESSTMRPHSSHDVHAEEATTYDHVSTTPLKSGENQELSDEYADKGIQNVTPSYTENELEQEHIASDNVTSHGDDDIETTKPAQHSQEDEQVGNSTGITNLVVDESIVPNGSLAKRSEQKSTSESKEHPPSLSEHHSGHDIDQNPGVELGKETDPNPATGHEFSVGQADPVEADIKPDGENQSNDQLTTLKSDVESITSTSPGAVSGINHINETSEDDLRESDPQTQLPEIEEPQSYHTPLVAGEFHPETQLPEIEEPQSFHTPLEPGEFHPEEANPWESDVKSENNLSADVPPRQAARSPLPVENDTVHGHEDLFDYDTASSYYGESEYYDHDDLHEDDTLTNDQIVQQMSNDPEEVPLHSDNGNIKEHMVEHTPNDYDDDALHTAIPPAEYINYAGNQGDSNYHPNGHDRTSPYYETETSADQMNSPVEQKFTYGDPETEEGSKTPSLMPVAHSMPEVSPFALKRDTPNRGGLAASIHAPSNSNWTPTRRVEQETQPEPDIDPEAFVPRDVTNVPWHARSDSVPRSLHSQSTLSSAPSSPVHSSLPIDKHEPVIRDSWPVSVVNGGRSRADTQFTDRNIGGDEFDPFKYDSGNTPNFYTAAPSRNTEIYHPEAQSNRNSLSGSPMFQKLRSMFEPGNAKGNDIGGSAETSPTRPSRPVSTIFQPVVRSRRSSLRKSINLTDQDDSPRRGGFLNEHEDEIDEHSALLQSTDERDRN